MIKEEFEESWKTFVLKDFPSFSKPTLILDSENPIVKELKKLDIIAANNVNIDTKEHFVFFNEEVFEKRISKYKLFPSDYSPYLQAVFIHELYHLSMFQDYAKEIDDAKRHNSKFFEEEKKAICGKYCKKIDELIIENFPELKKYIELEYSGSG